MLNIPVKRIPREEVVEVPRGALFGVGRTLPRRVRRRSYTVIAGARPGGGPRST